MSQQNRLPPPQFSDAFLPDAPPSPSPYSFNTKVMMGAIVVLFLVIFFILMLHVYAKWFLQRSSRSFAVRRTVPFSVSSSAPTGLHKDAIAHLPTFVYTAPSPPVTNLEAGQSDEFAAPPAPECAVCLSEFQECERGRILPSCKHIFHTDCIDMWFFSHSTCPLCRTEVIPTLATSTQNAPTDQVQQEAMEPSQSSTENNPAVSPAVEYPCNVLFWGNQTCVASSQEPSSSSSPMSPSLRMPGARALPQIAIDIPPIESNVLVSSSECHSAKCTTDQEGCSSQPLRSPGLRASIKRMLSRQSSRQKSSIQESSEESPK